MMQISVLKNKRTIICLSYIDRTQPAIRVYIHYTLSLNVRILTPKMSNPTHTRKRLFSKPLL